MIYKRTGYTLRVYGRESQHKTLREAYEHAVAMLGDPLRGAKVYCNATKVCLDLEEIKVTQAGESSPSSHVQPGSGNHPTKPS